MFKSNLIDYATERALNIWASVIHHREEGAERHPLYDEIFDEPMPPTPSDAPAECSEYLYDATPYKYRSRPDERPDYRILSAMETVERTFRKSGAPSWMRHYLLFKYPTTGRFMPKRPVVEGIDAADEPAKAFVKTGEVTHVFGCFSTRTFLYSAARAIEATERAFIALLRREIRNWSLPPSRPKRAVRSDSRRRRGTA
jgi:hypothetical protein